MKTKCTFNLFIITTIFLTLFFSNAALAASIDDYKVMKYATIKENGTDSITIDGRGIMSVKQGSSPDDGTAVIFKDYVNPKNFKATLEFLKDYGDGGGPQAGWYSINLSKTPNWFSSVGSIIKDNNISGVNIIFKLDATDKKKVLVELSKYTPGSGFKSLLSSTTQITIKNDWKCMVEMKNGTLYIDDNKVTDLNDAIDISMPDGKAFIGFGGFSEEFKGIKFNVTFNATAAKNAIDEFVKTTNPSSTSVASDSTTDTKAVTKSTASKNGNGYIIVSSLIGVLIIASVTAAVILKSNKSK